MVSRKMEGSEQQKRQKARDARERGKLPSEEGATTGASKQADKVKSGNHAERLAGKQGEKQDSVRQKSPESKPGYREVPEESGRGSRSKR